MSIRAKLAWTFILLLIFGITAISSYSILFIRNYLLSEGEKQILNDTEWLTITIENLRLDDQFETNLNEAARTSGYRLSIYDEQGLLFAEVPYYETALAPDIIDDQIRLTLDSVNKRFLAGPSDDDLLTAYSKLTSEFNPAGFLRVSIPKDQIYEPIKTIRWIIYTGMFISIGLVLIVSVLFSRYISRPILQLESAAREIADGNTDRTLDLDRKDEFGTLAKSLNRMAEKLRSDNLELVKMNQKQSQFFADITHEIRNPLHTIAGSLEMLQLGGLDAEKEVKYLQTAERQTQRIDRLFKDLLTLQRYDSDEHFIRKKTFPLRSVLEPLLETYQKEATEKGLKLIGKTGTEKVFADPDKIEQVLENLITNAIKFTNKGEIKINVQRMDTSDTIKIEVSDTGVGITGDHLNRLYDRFYRTDKARSRDKGGTGLGLSVVKSILNAHGSDIHVESIPGKGSTFFFHLPEAT